jgi:uncharacterized membrane protein
MTVKAKLPMTKKRKLTIIAIVAIVAASLLSFALIYVYSFSIQIEKYHVPTEYRAGSSFGLLIEVQYSKMNNPYSPNKITLSFSGIPASWASFYLFQGNITKSGQTITIVPTNPFIILSIQLPFDVQAGSYKVIVTGTNSLGLTASDTFTFTITPSS